MGTKKLQWFCAIGMLTSLFLFGWSLNHWTTISTDKVWVKSCKGTITIHWYWKSPTRTVGWSNIPITSRNNLKMEWTACWIRLYIITNVKVHAGNGARIPYWMPFLGFFIVLLTNEIKLHQKNKTMQNCCSCGYPKNGNESGICPECGTHL